MLYNDENDFYAKARSMDIVVNLQVYTRPISSPLSFNPYLEITKRKYFHILQM